MQKIISFVLMMVLGIIYGWSGIILGWLLTFTSVSISTMNLVFSLAGPVLILSTIVFLFWKKKGFLPVLGVVVGFIAGFLLLALGLSMGGK